MPLIKHGLYFLQSYWPQIIFILAISVVGYKVGYAVGFHANQSALLQEVSDLTSENQRQSDQLFSNEREKRQTAEQQIAALQQVRAKEAEQRTRADQLSLELLQAKTALEKDKVKRKTEFPDAIKKDGNAFTGIGPDSLRLYRANLGYPDHGVSDTGETASGATLHPANATRTGGGLSPSGLLNYSSEYGEWCLTLRGQLEKLNKFYDDKERNK